MSNLDPYEILGGLAHSASQQDIRRAYRKLSKKCHPDAPGGSQEAFERLKKAHDLLLDPARRQKYDATGEWTESAVDNELSEILAILSVEMEKIVALYAASIERIDLVGLMRQALQGNLREIAASRQKIHKTIAIWQRVERRFKVKSKKVKQEREQEQEQRPNHLQQIVGGKIRDLHHHLEVHNQREKLVAKAVEMLDGVVFERDGTAARDRTMAAATSWGGVAGLGGFNR